MLEANSRSYTWGQSQHTHMGDHNGVYDDLEVLTISGASGCVYGIATLDGKLLVSICVSWRDGSWHVIRQSADRGSELVGWGVSLCESKCEITLSRCLQLALSASPETIDSILGDFGLKEQT